MSNTLIAVCLAAVCLTVEAQEPFVYLVKAGGCTTAPSQRSLTGFRVNDPDRKGIITALHGVAGCSVITARAGVGEIYTSLYVGAVDVESDVALLSSQDLQSRGAEGLTPLDGVPWEQIKKVRVYGHPFGTAEHGDELTVREPALRPLEDDVPATETLGKLQLRSSPSTKQRILSLQGPLEPGHSGAPILYQGKLIAIANGGLFGGTAGLGWAVPYEGVRLTSASKSPRLPMLASLSPDGLFSFEPGEGPIVETGPDMKEIGNQLKRILDGRGSLIWDTNLGTNSDEVRFDSFGNCSFSFSRTLTYQNNNGFETSFTVPMSEVGATLEKVSGPVGDFEIALSIPDQVESIKIDRIYFGTNPRVSQTQTYATTIFFANENQAKSALKALNSAIQACKK